MCYATASLGVLWLLDLARTKTTSVDGWVKEVVEKIVIGVVVGPGAMLCTMWGEREDALVHAWKAEGRRGSELIQSWVSCKTDVRCNLSNDLRFFSEEHAPFGKDTVSVESICMYSYLGIIYQPFYLHPNLRPRSK